MSQRKSRQELLDTGGQVLCNHKYRMASLQATANVGDRNIQVMEIYLCDDCGANFKGERSVTRLVLDHVDGTLHVNVSAEYGL